MRCYRFKRVRDARPAEPAPPLEFSQMATIGASAHCSGNAQTEPFHGLRRGSSDTFSDDKAVIGLYPAELAA